MNELNLKKEKEKILLLHILFPIIVVAILAFSILLILALERCKDEFKIRSYIRKNSNQIEKYINGEIEKKNLDQSLTFKGDIDKIIYCQDEDDCYYKFAVGSIGSISEGCYTGFYYVTNDTIQNFGYYDRIINGNNIKSYSIEDYGTDNILYIKKIKNHFYYYEDCF